MPRSAVARAAMVGATFSRSLNVGTTTVSSGMTVHLGGRIVWHWSFSVYHAAAGRPTRDLADVYARQGARLWGSLVSCGRLAIGQTAALARDGGGKRGTLWVARRLPACPT